MRVIVITVVAVASVATIATVAFIVFCARAIPRELWDLARLRRPAPPGGVPLGVLVRSDDGPDVYGPYDEDDVYALAVRVSGATGLETEVVNLQPWQPTSRLSVSTPARAFSR